MLLFFCVVLNIVLILVRSCAQRVHNVKIWIKIILNWLRWKQKEKQTRAGKSYKRIICADNKDIWKVNANKINNSVTHVVFNLEGYKKYQMWVLQQLQAIITPL